MTKPILSASHFAAAVAALLVSYGSSAVIIYQAALSFGSTPIQINSWFTSLGIACGLLTLGLSLKYKTPIMVAWCTPGAALMVGMTGIPLSEATGAFLFAGALMLFFSLTGLFNRLVSLIPKTLACAMLAGILINFGSRVFVSVETQPLLVGMMLLTYLLSKIRFPRYSLMFMLLIGFGCAYFLDLLNLDHIRWNNPQLVWLNPSFNLQVIISVGIPLFITSLVTQNVPAMTILKMYRYDNIPEKPLVSSSALATVLMAPFGAFMVNLAAISAAITMGDDVDPDPKKRYIANIWLAVLYFLAAVLGGTIVSVFDALPKELLTALAGIAIFGTLLSNLLQAWNDEPTREASLITLLTSASGMTLLGIGSAFWGLIFGIMVYHLNLYVQRQKR
ncbi:benzoate/H(+) symporter BenE family transporter [Pelistega europaea]|uniref:Benzoate/H(+) symporter BenE family transporter n=1 Tax=Pelistega europaea TaxID=106147 RepID=A0A7Y4L8W5_9BURK|nr:benzoate/H(+) symporter BenE family transporter [Pelistega europaea]NOL49144.1 benzoate/H(+) symporter BenE family transporter [Pelistega europaea]